MKNAFNKEEITLIGNLHEKAFDKVEKAFFNYSKNAFCLSVERKKIIENEFMVLKTDFINSLIFASKLAQGAYEGKCHDEKRLSYFNPTMKHYKNSIIAHYPPAANAWILDGIVFESQRAGIKKLVGFDNNNGYLLDVLGSASSIALGAENPWLVKADRYEDHLGIRDNICSAYHPGLRQAFALSELAKLYPGKRKIEELVVHAESSGTIVDSIAIESTVAYAEKKYIHDKNLKKILAIDGTWAGGYGTAREATGFHINDNQEKRTGKTIWIDRCLPAPTTENKERFLSLLENKVKKGVVAGIYLEPDIIGDIGILSVDKNVLENTKKILKTYGLPLIADCVQQLGRTGGYWGENVETVLSDYPLLIVTTAKSASNGQPFSFTIMPKEIADAAYTLSQITTNQMNGPLLRVLIVAQILKNEQIQKWILQKSNNITAIAKLYGFAEGEQGLRGKFLNRAIYVGSNDKVKLVQIALLIEDGILVGALPSGIRYQPMLFDLSTTTELTAHAIFRRVKQVLNNIVSPSVIEAYQKMKYVSTGLAR